MQVFKLFFKILKRNIKSPLLYIIISLIVAIPMAKNDTAKKFEKSSLDICVIDEDETPESEALIDLISKENKILTEEKDMDKLLDMLYYERIDYALIISKGYSEKLAAGETEGILGSYHVHDSYSVTYLEQFLNEYTDSVKAGLAGGMELSEAVEVVGEAMSQEAEVELVNPDSGSNSEFPPFFSAFFRYMPYIMISAVLYSICPVMLAMTKKDVRYRTNCSSLSPNSFTKQLFMGTALSVLVVWLILMTAGICLFGEMYHGREWLAVLNSFIFALFSASLGVFIASFDVTDNVLNLIVQVTGLGMSFLCGIFVPLSVLSDGVIAAARFLPAYWYVRADLMICGNEPFSASDIAAAMVIEVGFAVTFAILSVLVRRLRYNGSSSVSATY